MAQTLAQVVRTVTTDFTDPVTKRVAQNGIAANMAAMDNVSEQDLKAAQVICLAFFLQSGVTINAGTDYTNDYAELARQALAMFRPIVSRLDTKQKNLLDTTLTANAAIYANGLAGLLNVNAGMAEVQLLRNYSAEELDLMIAFLRFKTGI